MSQQRHIVESEAGLRVDHVLAQWMGLSRREVTRLLERGLVRLNGSRLGRGAKGQRVAARDELHVAKFTPEAAQRAEARPDVDLAIVAQGDGWLIADKPAGRHVHPLRAEQNDTLLNAVIARFPEIHSVGEGGLRSGVVHRLDRGTSGAVVLALDDARWRWLRTAFQEHTIKKTYRAIVHGGLHGSDCDTLALVVQQHHPARVVVADKETRGARICTLAWRAVETFKDATLLEVDLGTGFLHQVRVMLAHRGHPVLGDTVYGLPDATQRPMLHAYSLACEDVRGVCEPPNDFTEILETLRDGPLPK